MTPTDLRAWRDQMQYTQAKAAQALGLSLDGYKKLELGITQPRDRRMGLACAALANGLQPWSDPICKAKIVGRFVGTQ